MSNEDTTSPVVEEDETVDSATEVANEANPSDDNQNDGNPDLEEGNPDDDSEEVEYEGKTYRLPKELKDGILRNADYTRKTQEVAEERRAVQAERQALAERQQVQDTFRREHAAVDQLEEYIKYYKNVDWDAADHQNPELSRTEYRRFQQLQSQLQDAKTELQTKINQGLREKQAAKAQALQETGKTLAREIPGFNQEYVQKLMNKAAEFGFSEQDIANDPDPRAFRLLNALLKADTKTSAQAVGNRIQKQEATAPIRVVGTKSPPPSPLSDKADIKTWMEARNKKSRR